MFIKYSKLYLFKVQNLLITNQFILSIVSLLELLPIIYNMLLCGFYFSSYQLPPFFQNYIYYMSIYDIFRKHSFTKNNSYPFYFLLIIFILFLSYFIYRYVLLPKITKNLDKVNEILINIYEILVFRVFTIFFYEIIIHELITRKEIYYIIITVMLLFFVVAINFIHFNLNFIYLDLNSNREFKFDNHVLLICDCNFILIKMLICLANSTHEKYPNLFLFANCGLIGVNIFLFLQESFCLFYNKYQYMPVDLYLNIRIFVSYFMLIMQLIIIFSKYYDNYYFIYSIIESALFSGGITYGLIKYSQKKILNTENYVGMVLYLLKERKSKYINHIINGIINQHNALCNESICKVCKKIKNEEPITPEQLAAVIYKMYIKKTKLAFSTNLTFKEMYYLLDLYFAFISIHKNLIKIMLKYNQIKANVKNSTTAINDKLRLKSISRFSINFYINLDLLYHGITTYLLQNNDNQKLIYLIKTDKYNQEIKTFIKYLRNFLSLNLKSPQEIIKLAKRFADLTKTIDFDYLVSKDNKFNYPCLINSYIMEEIFNNNLNNLICIGDLIHSVDELLDFKYKENSLLLAMYDITYNKIIIKSTGKDLIHLKNKTFEKIFPPFLRKEGLIRLIKNLKQNRENYFEFYCFQKLTGTVDRFKMKFMGIPSLDFDCQSLYIACNYAIEKENYFIFEVKNYLIKDNKILVAISDSVSRLFRITQEHINNTHLNKTYLTFSQIFNAQTNTINFDSLQYYLRKKFGIKNVRFYNKENFIYSFKESVGKYEIYVLQENKSQLSINKTLKIQDDNIVRDSEQANNYNNIYMTQDGTFNFFEATHTGMSSSQLTYSAGTTFSKGMNSAKSEQTQKYKKFFVFTYILIIFNICILIVISLFLAIQLMNNVELEKTFIIIKNFNDFQSYFFHSALSVFSLTCNADYLTQEVCCNQFTEFCVNFSLEQGLTMNELMNDYLARELTYKSDLVISSLKTWERDRFLINSKELDEILAEEFTFCLVEEVNLKLSIVSIKLNFEDAIKRFINLVNLIPTFDNHLTSVIWTVTSNGYEDIDLTNVWLDKRPIYGVWLTEVQKHYYACLLNFQKYLLRMYSMADLLFKYYESKISSTRNQIMLFIILFIVLHLIMLIMSGIFIFKYKVLHMGFFVLIFLKTEDKEFKSYYQDKLKTLLILLDLYKKHPNELINHLNKLKLSEKQRMQYEGKPHLKEKQYERQITIQKDSNNNLVTYQTSFSLSVEEIIHVNFNNKQLHNIYNKAIIFGFLFKLTILFMGYIVVIIILYVVILSSIHNLSLMNKYIKYNYDSSNNIYLNLALIQIMSLTNQTDVQMDLYFGNNDSINNQANDGYVRRNLQKTSEILSEVEQMERKYSYFQPLSNVIHLNCETLYDEIHDPIINAMIKGYPNSNYVGLLAKYCYVYSNLRTYQDDKMTLNIITYKTSKVLDLFLDQTYETYQIITNCLLIYQIYTEILMIVRPIRRYLYKYIIEDVIKKILNNHSILMIIFLLINFIYEILILVSIKFGIIDKIIQSSKEIIVVAKAFECI